MTLQNKQILVMNLFLGHNVYDCMNHPWLELLSKTLSDSGAAYTFVVYSKNKKEFFKVFVATRKDSNRCYQVRFSPVFKTKIA